MKQYIPQIFVIPHSLTTTQIKKTLQSNLQEILSDKKNTPNIKYLNQDQDTVSIDMIREFNYESRLASHSQEIRIFCLLHFEQATLPAQNALLKTLEEPGKNTQIIITTTQFNQLLPTIKSRSKINFVNETDNLKNKAKSNQTQKEMLDFLINKNENIISYQKIFQWSKKYKKREEAEQLVNFLIDNIHDYLTKKNSYETEKTRLIKVITDLDKTLEFLQSNVNVRLSLENVFIKQKKI